ncbi:hypothetical protein, variant 1 [Aphanomyces invadans]|uniref:Uncharacterized protein n=1 Tax=Aphanomyces invadans TaxID=157072 RepID=A0A024UUL8_9STRA|nr:hypothetical protein H310_00428 [Aphanomyces invadans]XP_008861440.1 hypothetical protein, variant 1 [Aphanomyces invadans]ETW10028.1 hypothetical protein H310_00428 [Aphanomyces invadans]ETW10029.1 hypothetical protein, variant 1 [Aphanomyces invadans]|eukprot:XP_008861439.1 hypothetical protein H310_00428 [Aphanomyces invadans]
MRYLMLFLMSMPPRKTQQNPVVDRRPGRVAQLASQKPVSVGSRVPNMIPWCFVPARYRSALLAPIKCGERGACRWLDRRCTVSAMSGLVQTMRSSWSATSGVATGWHVVILKSSSTFSVYTSCVMVSVLRPRLQVTWTLSM